MFGGGVDDGLALTAVGDPIQSIYGWRGASATNLPRFTTDFPRSDGTPGTGAGVADQLAQPAAHAAGGQRGISGGAPTIGCGARAAAAAGRPARHRPLCVAPGCAGRTGVDRRPPAGHYQRAQAEGASPPTAAVLVRRNADAAPIADALRARGIPVEVVGLAGLLSVPEVADVVAMLRLVADPSAGAAAMRVLTGSRWRLGARDIAALWRRARLLAGRTPAEAPTPESIAMAAGPMPTPRAWPTRSATRARPTLFGCGISSASVRWPAELSALRGHLNHSLPDLVAEVRRVLGVDCEVRASIGQRLAAGAGPGAEHLDAFADVVAGYAERHRATDRSPRRRCRAAGLPGRGRSSREWLAAGARGGLSRSGPGPYRALRERFGMAGGGGRTPIRRNFSVDRVAGAPGSTDAAELPPLLRGDRAAAGSLGVPVLDTSAVTNRKQLSDNISEHRRQLDQRRVDEERRLLYVGITRAEDTLLVSGHHWGSTGIKPRGPSDFLCELKDVIDRSAEAGDPCGVVERWAPEPADGERNPLHDNVIEAIWPVDPLASGAATSNAGRRWWARRCRPMPGRLRRPTSRAGPPTSMRCWPSGPAPGGRRARTCPVKCRSAVWWNWPATRWERHSG